MKVLVEFMPNGHLRWGIVLQESVELFPVEGFPPASSFHPLKEEPDGPEEEHMNCSGITRHRIILGMAPEFRAEHFPQIAQCGSNSILPTPPLHYLQFASYPPVAGLNLRHIGPLLALPHVEREP